jgi:hypothetical protein
MDPSASKHYQPERSRIATLQEWSGRAYNPCPSGLHCLGFVTEFRSLPPNLFPLSRLGTPDLNSDVGFYCKPPVLRFKTEAGNPTRTAIFSTTSSAKSCPAKRLTYIIGRQSYIPPHFGPSVLSIYPSWPPLPSYKKHPNSPEPLPHKSPNQTFSLQT